MTPDGKNVDGAAVFVVRRVVDELVVEGCPNIREELGAVVGFENGLMAVVEGAVADDEAVSTGFEEGAVFRGDAVDDAGKADDIIASFPTGAFERETGLEGLVDLGKSPGHILAVVPADAGEGAEVIG